MTNVPKKRIMTNDQTTMTKEEPAQPYHFFGYWLLSVSLVIGIWSLVISLMRSGHNDSRSQPRSGPGVQWVLGDMKL